MPQATPELQAKFPGGDAEALAVIDDRFVVDTGFVIRPRLEWLCDFTATDRENDAIDYLCDEWDYGYDHAPMADAPPPKWSMSVYEVWKTEYDIQFLMEEFPTLAAYAVAKER